MTMDDRPPTPSDPEPPATGPPDAGPGAPASPPTAKAEVAPAGCAPSLEELYQYMDGALDETRKAHFQSHLDGCGGCGELYHVQAQFLRLIEVRCRIELPPELPDRVFGAIAELGLPPKRKH